MMCDAIYLVHPPKMAPFFIHLMDHTRQPGQPPVLPILVLLTPKTGTLEYQERQLSI